MIPVVPHPTAMTSPQYLSLHHERHQPPSASLLPNCCLCAAVEAALLCCCCCCCCKACATREAEAPPSVVAECVCVGVASARVWVLEKYAGELFGTVDWISNSSISCQVVSDGCSMQS